MLSCTVSCLHVSTLLICAVPLPFPTPAFDPQVQAMPRSLPSTVPQRHMFKDFRRRPGPASACFVQRERALDSRERHADMHLPVFGCIMYVRGVFAFAEHDASRIERSFHDNRASEFQKVRAAICGPCGERILSTPAVLDLSVRIPSGRYEALGS